MPAQVGLFQEVFQQIQRVVDRREVPRASAKRLALLVTGVIAARSSVLARVAAEVAALGLTEARQVESVERRLRRTLNDEHLTATRCYQTALREVLDWPAMLSGGGRVVLAVDDSSQDDRIHLLRVSLTYWGGSLPLAWAIWEQNLAQPDGHYWAEFDRVLDQVAGLLPAGVEVVLTGDRFFDIPAFIDRVRARGWHWVVRLKANSDLRFRDYRGREGALRDRLHRHLNGPGQRWKARGQAFKNAGWRDVSVVGVWAPGAAEPLVTLTDLPPRWDVLRTDDRRFWIEPGFRVDKSAAWRWEDSQVQGLAHHARLLLALAWASLTMLCLGLHEAQDRLAALAAASPPADRPPPKPQHARASLLTLGLRAVRAWLYRTHDRVLRWRLTDLVSDSWQRRWYQQQARRYIFCYPVRP